MPSEALNSGILVSQICRNILSQPVAEFSRKANRLRRTHPIAGEWLPNIYLVRIDSEQVRELCQQPSLDNICAIGLAAGTSRRYRRLG